MPFGQAGGHGQARSFRVCNPIISIGILTQGDLPGYHWRVTGPVPTLAFAAAAALSAAACKPSQYAGTGVPAEQRSASDVTKVRHGNVVAEVGVIDGASYRLDIPDGWNGELIVHCHGYRAVSTTFDPGASDRVAQTFAAVGFAVAQSGYSATGYALLEAARDTENLRSYAVAQLGPPKQTWLSGESLGGSLAMMLLETYPESYDGGLSLCAPLGPALSYIKAIVFDALVLFEYWVPAVLPSPDSVPLDYQMSEARSSTLLRLLDENPTAAAALRARTTARTNSELGSLLDLFTYIMGDLRRRWGGNPFDNRNTIYAGFGDDRAVNEGVKRYSADSVAQSKIIDAYTPTGQLQKPLLALRTLYDPIVTAFNSDSYSELAQIAGRGDFFVQKFSSGQGHCEFSDNERHAAIQELRAWRQSGLRPLPGRLEVSEPE